MLILGGGMRKLVSSLIEREDVQRIRDERG
jgi:hypothetical protein